MFPLKHDLPGLAARLRSGALDLHSFLDDLEAYFRRREPAVLAFVPEEGRFARLRAAADALLAAYPDPAVRPPLFGIPVAVKDIFHVDGLETRAGSRLPPARLKGGEARSVTQLKAAGALILGKAVTTEFAYFGSGPTHNPFRPGHTPGGSSSGSAAAVGAGLAPLALGTQTIGSINRPAAFCGVVGYKPSRERISRAGVIPLSESLDHIGTFTRHVAGAALAASLLCADWGDFTPRRPVLGIPEGPYLEHAEPAGAAHFQETIRRLADAGFVIRRVRLLGDFTIIRERHVALMAAEAARFHRRWFAEFGDLYHPKTVALLEHGQSQSDDAIAAGRASCLALREALEEARTVYGVDLWLSPPAPGPAPAGLDATGDPVMNLPWTHAGLPTVNLPTGLSDDGLPLGLQLAGGFNQDEQLLADALQIEAAVGVQLFPKVEA